VYSVRIVKLLLDVAQLKFSTTEASVIVSILPSIQVRFTLSSEKQKSRLITEIVSSQSVSTEQVYVSAAREE
jgi:hypothetical protein